MIDDIYISLEDLKRVCFKNRGFIIRAGLYAALLFFIYFILTPLSYQAVATFKKAASSSEQSFDFRNLIRTFSSGASEGATAPLMLSRTILSKAVEELGLQLVVHPEGGRWRILKQNLLAELGKKPADPDLFEFRKVSYPDECPRLVYLRFSTPKTFDLLDQTRRTLVTGCLNERVSYDTLIFTLVQTPTSLQLGKLYPLSCIPLQQAVGAVKVKTSVKPLKEDRNIVTITFSDQSRQRATLFVNTLMSKYEEFLIEQNHAIITAQLRYLEQRQNELNATLDKEIQDHTVALQQSLSSQGFLGIEEEMSSILEPLRLYRQRVNEIDVEMAGLEKKIPRDSLFHQFGKNLAGQITEVSKTLHQLTQDQPLSSSIPLFSTQVHALEKARLQWQNAPAHEVDIYKNLYETQKKQMASHLHSWVGHLTLRRKNLQEGSAYFDQPQVDFTGMTLSACRELFQSYSHQVDDLQTQMKQVVFFRDHLQEPHFEISTLSNILTDSVTEQLVQKSTTLEAELCDMINHSGREHERLKERLSTHKRFLEAHLSQILELGKIRIQLMYEKLQSLHTVMHTLLQKEKTVLENKIEDLKIRLQEIPQLWHLDKRLKFRSELTKGMMEGLTEVTESKNLSQHLYQVESKPLDPALTPYSPLPPQLLLKSIGIGLCALFLTTLFFLIQAFLKGLPASLSTLRLMGAETAGLISHSDVAFDNLSTLRKISSFLLERRRNEGSIVALLGEKELSCFFNLAHLFAFHHQKILFIDLSSESASGLWHYLTHSDEKIPLCHQDNYDLLPAGPPTRYSFELLSSPRFQQLLQNLQQDYDFIILLKQAPLNSQDSLQLLTLAHCAVILTHEESPTLLQPYLHWSRQKEKECVTFAQIFNET